MRLKQKLPVSFLLFTFRGRITRSTFWIASIFIWSTFYILFNTFDVLLGYSSTLLIYPLLFWSLIAVSVKRLHDHGKTGWWLWLMLLPIIGAVWLLYWLGFKKGNPHENRYGWIPGSKDDYFVNVDGERIPHLKTKERIINDVTRLNPVIVAEVIKPGTVEELCQIVKNTERPVSIGGGRFSMGGQTASHQTLHIDMRGLNRVIAFSKEEKLITVETGIRWCDIQEYIDPHDLSIKIMQTYANFTVGGALSVNAHGRYIGLGPLILSVRSVEVVLADGSLIHASKEENPEIFFGTIGGYNGIGIIVRATLELTDNVPVKRIHKKLKRTEYKDFFFAHIRNNKKAVFHNGDIYPPDYSRIRAVTWEETNEKPTVKTRLMPLKESYPAERYFLWAVTETIWGKWRREYIIEPLVYMKKKIHWRNYEAGYDVAELEPRSRMKSTYVLQEYFVPVQRFDDFCTKMAEIFIRQQVNVVNISIRHALADPGSYLAWAREEVFAFVVYYKQKTGESDKNKVAIWTRELVDAVLSVNGTYYLPYQVHPTEEQFHKAYPNAKKLFELKKKLDPGYKFRNIIWDTYYHPK